MFYKIYASHPRHLCLYVSLARRPGRGMLSFEFTYREKRHGGCS